MGQQIVGDLANCVTTALSQAIPTLVDNLNPIAKTKAGASIVGGFINPKGESGNPPTTSVPDGTSTPANNSSPQSTQSVMPPAAADPAFAEVLQSTTYLAALNSIILGKDGNVDWERAKGRGGDRDPKSTIQFLSMMLSDAKSRFSRIATNAEPSVTLTTVLSVCSQVCDRSQKVIGN